MKLVKSNPSTDVEKFMDLFYNKNKKYRIKSINGEIVACDTIDKNIIKFLEGIGLKENDNT
jgi:hypothetical protein